MRRPNMNPLLALAACAVVGVGGCEPAPVVDPPAAVDEFEANRASVQYRMEAIDARLAAWDVPDDRTAHEQFAAEWKEEWDDIEREVRKLKKQLARLTKSFDRQFARMQRVARTIDSPQARAEELSENADLQRRWLATVAEAHSNFKKMDEQVRAARDFHKTFRLAVMRGRAEAKLAEVRGLSQQVKGTAAELEKVTTEGRALIR
ncbi:hypothetical protein R5W24_000734 [Gemmata sp. JC717]|uniref:hypothetical protein n=1 Tax=Gemmata algarum TaxID=2975278 RepID=UPI0021BBB466|nr:hypothetical protein [Gemmata algarum]MDY3551655.1 hypothetical protein [Gemmata algarum]